MSKIETIHLIHHSHLDIGYTHDQPIVLDLHERFISEALALAERAVDGGKDKIHLPPGNINVPSATLVKAFRLLARAADGSWTEAARITDSHQRLVRVPLAVETDAVRLVIDETWGAERTRIFGFEVE
jgi:hypothetical protein